MTDVVGAELDFVAFGSEGGWPGHDAGVEHEGVETGVGLGGDAGGGGFDGGEGGEVEFDEGNARGGDGGLDIGDGGWGRVRCFNIVGRSGLPSDFDLLRAASHMRSGLCLLSWWMDSLPSPSLPWVF